MNGTANMTGGASLLAGAGGWAVHDEFVAMRARFRRALLVSLGLHAVLAASLALVEGARPRVPDIIEVTWLEPAATVVAPALVPASAPVPARKPEAAPAPEPEPQAARPRRQHAPVPATAGQRDAARERPGPSASQLALATAAPVAPPSTTTRAALAAAPDAGAGLARAAAATMMPMAARGRPATLVRGPESAGEALALTRGPATAGGSQAVLAAAVLPAAAGADGEAGGNGRAAADRAAEARAGAGDILLEGPAAGRAVLQRALPAYPAWAQRQAVEAVVRLRFIVLPDGRVREDVVVERTGGFRDFDESAVAALNGWRFAPLAGGEAAGQWGTITFRFRLRG
jgi:TonB family protein